MRIYPTSDIREIKRVLGKGYIQEWNTFDRNNRLIYFFEDIKKRVEWGFIDDSFIDISLGVIWSISTGRINATVQGWLSGCTIDQLLSVLEELHDHCKTMLEVVFYLNTIKVHHKGYDNDMHSIYKRINPTQPDEKASYTKLEGKENDRHR